MKKSVVYQNVLDIVREVARGRPVTLGTDFSRIRIGPWQRQRFFGPLRDGFTHSGVNITGGGLTRESFTHFQTLREVQAAVWNSIRRGSTPRKAGRPPEGLMFLPSLDPIPEAAVP